jgi:hypothetical protein
MNYSLVIKGLEDTNAALAAENSKYRHALAASNIETDHGDDPATNTLAAQLLVDMEETA